MKTLPLTFLLILPALAWAQTGTLYKCQGPDGRTTYTNQKPAKGQCEILMQDKPVTTFAAPKPRQATPADFPRVNNDQQKARDNDRRAILEQELAAEQKHLDEAKKALAEQESSYPPEERVVGGGIHAGKREERLKTYRDRVALHERNIESLRKELANLK